MNLHEVVVRWFEENKRDLPWRNSSPWGVMVSEFMLQQTPVSRVLPRWYEWMERWPTPQALSEASPAEVITAWERLGYPRRALRLLSAATEIAVHHNGEVPADIETLESLPGVGEYTASAISAFAFSKPSLVLDINVRRVFARVLDGVQYPTGHITSAEKSARRALMPDHDAHMWAAATMELGALVCVTNNPHCDICPLSDICRWRQSGYPQSEQRPKSQGWHGTDRKCRGTIIQALRENESLTDVALKSLWNSDSQVEKALQTLLVDGLISKSEKGEFSLPQSRFS